MLFGVYPVIESVIIFFLRFLLICSSSMVTLKAGIEGMMKRMIPEVKEVVAEAE